MLQSHRYWSTRAHKSLTVNMEYGAKRNSISPSTSVFSTNFACLHRNSLFVCPRPSSYKTCKIGRQSPKNQIIKFSVSRDSYQDAPQDAGISVFTTTTTDEFHRRVDIQRCGQETGNSVTLANLEKVFIHIVEASTPPSAAISCCTRKRGLEVEEQPPDPRAQ